MDARAWERLKELYEQARALPASERDPFLDRACEKDPTLRTEIEDLLGAEAEAESFFESLARAVPLRDAPEAGSPPFASSPSSSSSEVETDPRPDPLLGRTVRQYRIESRLGAGGMGVVYRAHDTSLDRPVALKFLPPHLGGDETAAERFLVEARAAAALDHPNVCTIHEIGKTEGGRRFLAMACYEGETLKQKLRRGPLPIAEANEYARQIAAALAAAHDRGIVHRDIKPGNVLVTPGGVVKVLDFGLAKLADVSLTGAGRTLGTVAYMAPEQLRGEAVDARTDLWALGVVWYEMLAGRRPFPGEDTASVAHRIQNEEPPPVEGLRSDVSAETSERLGRLLAKDPAERPRSAEALQVGSPDRRPGRVATSVRRWAPRAASLVALAILVYASLAYTGVLDTPVGDREPIRSLAVLPLENRSGDPEQEYLADGMTEALIDQLGRIGALRVTSMTSVLEYREARGRVPQIAGELGVRAIVEGSVSLGEDRFRVSARLIDATRDEVLWSRDYDRAFGDILAIQSQMAREIAGALNAELSRGERERVEERPTHHTGAYGHYLQGNDYLRRESRKDWETAERMYESAVELDPGFAKAWERLVYVRGIQVNSRYDTVKIAAARRALERLRELGPDLDETHAAEGWFAYWGELDFERALREFETVHDRHPRDPEVLWALARVHWWAARREEALPVLEQLVELDPRNPEVASTIAIILADLRRFEEAERYADLALSLAPDNHFYYVRKWRILALGYGDTARAAGLVREARRHVRQEELAWLRAIVAEFRRDFPAAIEGFRSWPGPSRGKYMFVARLAHQTGEAELARIYADSLEQLATARLAKATRLGNVRQMGVARYELGRVAAIHGRHEEAIRQGEEGLRLLPLDSGAPHPAFAQGLVWIYAQVGHEDEAVRLLERLLEVPGGETVHSLRFNPVYDALRDHAGFQALLRERTGSALQVSS